MNDEHTTNESCILFGAQAPIPQIAVHFIGAEQKVLIDIEVHHVISVQVNIRKYRMAFRSCQPAVKAKR
jgi:predicted nicotinamide N-methyase